MFMGNGADISQNSFGCIALVLCGGIDSVRKAKVSLMALELRK